MVLVISIDGRLAPSFGGKAELGGPGDKEVLEDALYWADGALIGAGTLRAHQSICLIKKPSLLKKRKIEGKASQPIAIVVGNGEVYSPEWLFFKQPIQRWLISKRNTIDNKDINYNHAYEKELILKKTWRETLLNVKELGINKLALLGGSILTESIMREDLIDELQLTITPKVLGGQNTWIPSKVNNLSEILGENKAWNLIETKKLVHNEILIRYVRNYNSNKH